MSRFKRINKLVFSLESQENRRFQGNISLIIRLLLEAKFGDDPLRNLSTRDNFSLECVMGPLLTRSYLH